MVSLGGGTPAVGDFHVILQFSGLNRASKDTLLDNIHALQIDRIPCGADVRAPGYTIESLAVFPANLLQLKNRQNRELPPSPTRQPSSRGSRASTAHGALPRKSNGIKLENHETLT
jgi:hypothetical protein